MSAHELATTKGDGMKGLAKWLIGLFIEPPGPTTSDLADELLGGGS
jgi:hypothetical protein